MLYKNRKVSKRQYWKLVLRDKPNEKHLELFIKELKKQSMEEELTSA